MYYNYIIMSSHVSDLAIMTGDTADKDKLFRSDHPTMGGFLR